VVGVKLGNYISSIGGISVELTKSKTHDSYGIRVYVSLGEVIQIVQDYIYNNYERIDIPDNK